jgi:hypothetical protein
MKKVCKYQKEGKCYLSEMEDCDKIGDTVLDGIHICPFHSAYDYYCFEDAMIELNSSVKERKP